MMSPYFQLIYKYLYEIIKGYMSLTDHNLNSNYAYLLLLFPFLIVVINRGSNSILFLVYDDFIC